MPASVHCTIYKSKEKSELYIYLKDNIELDDIPDEIRKPFRTTIKVMELELSPQKSLARCDVNEVMKNLQEHGFHIQLPPGDPALLVYS
jgi:uncharacterized protein